MKGKECKIHRLVSDVLVLAAGQILFVRYHDVRKYDGQEGWFLPDDYLGYGEHPADAVHRILYEQVGLDVGNIEVAYIESLGGEDGGLWHLIFHHKIELDKTPNVAAGTNVKAVKWFSLNNPPDPSSVAHHGWARDAIEKILKRSQ